MNELELIKLKDEISREKAKIKKILSYIKTYEDDLKNTEGETLRENILIDNLNDIFQAAKKMSI